MTICYLGLGSNLKTPQRQLRNAAQTLRKKSNLDVLTTSNLYRSKFFGLGFQPDYYNMVIKINTRLSPQKLLTTCQSIEKQFKRVRKKRWDARTLDIDLLLYGNKKINLNNLTIPHKEMFKRDFVLKPLLEIKPEISWNNTKTCLSNTISTTLVKMTL